MKKTVLIFGLITTLGVIGSFFGVKIWIKSEANNTAEHYVEIFQKDKTESLLAVLDSEEYSLNEKNRVVWALGVLKEEQALGVLESLITNEKCNHSTHVCQYEVQKAILKINGDFWSELFGFIDLRNDSH